MDKKERFLVGSIGIIISGIGAKLGFDYFLGRGVQSDLAGTYAIIIFLAVLGAFGLIAFNAEE
jgi:hypothetical protein